MVTGLKVRLKHLPACLVVGLTYGFGVYIGAVVAGSHNPGGIAFIAFWCVTAALCQFRAFEGELPGDSA